MLLYVGIGWKLITSKKKATKDKTEGSGAAKKLSQKEKRNRTLTKAFAISTVAWIVLWSFYYAQQVIDIFELRDRLQGNYYTHSVQRLRDTFFSMYSVVNPVCFIVINRQFQEPIIKLFKWLPCPKRKGNIK